MQESYTTWLGGRELPEEEYPSLLPSTVHAGYPMLLQVRLRYSALVLVAAEGNTTFGRLVIKPQRVTAMAL